MKRKEIFNWYNFLEANPLFKQVKVDELLFAAYDCPLEASPLDYWVQKNYFCYIIKGGARWKTPNEDYTFKVGDAAFLTRGAHRVYKIGNGEFCALIMFLTDEFISSVVKKEITSVAKQPIPKGSDAVMPLMPDQTLTDYFCSVLNYFSQTKPPSKSLLKIKFKELIINLITKNNNPRVTEYFRELSLTTKRDIKSIMDEHFMFNLKLEEFADLSGRSLSSFNRDFSKLYNTTPGRWLKKRRLEYARFLLETTDLNINEIVLNIGFENTSHFIKSFKAKFKVPPLKFKKSIPKK